MPLTMDQILAEALALDPIERDEVAHALFQSIVPGEFESGQVAEIQRRVAVTEAEKFESIPGERVMRELRERF